MQTDYVPLAERDGFLELVRSGISLHEVARRMGCSRHAVREAALSQSTLALAPSVAVLANEVRRKAIAAYTAGKRSPYSRKK